MSTFIDPVKIRRLAATGDPFYKGAAWILDQQDAADVADAEAARRDDGPRDSHAAVVASPGSLPTPNNAADLGAPRIG